MKAIANCESTGLLHRLPDGSLLPNKKGSSARGVFQVLMSVHAEEMQRMELDPNDDDDYTTYVRHIRNTQGLSAWKESSDCWNPKYASN